MGYQEGGIGRGRIITTLGALTDPDFYTRRQFSRRQTLAGAGKGTAAIVGAAAGVGILDACGILKNEPGEDPIPSRAISVVVESLKDYEFRTFGEISLQDPFTQLVGQVNNPGGKPTSIYRIYSQSNYDRNKKGLPYLLAIDGPFNFGPGILPEPSYVAPYLSNYPLYQSSDNRFPPQQFHYFSGINGDLYLMPSDEKLKASLVPHPTPSGKPPTVSEQLYSILGPELQAQRRPPKTIQITIPGRHVGEHQTVDHVTDPGNPDAYLFVVRRQPQPCNKSQAMPDCFFNVGPDPMSP